MICIRPHCGRKQVARGLCSGHYQKARRAGILRDAVRPATPLVDGTGTRRRLQDLALYGYVAEDIAGRLGISVGLVKDLRFGHQRSLRACLDEQIRQLHLQLEGTDGGNAHAAALARGNGYLHLGCYVDPDSPDSPLVDDYQVTRQAGRDEIEHLMSFGWDDQDIARRLGCTESYVYGLRRKMIRASSGT